MIKRHLNLIKELGEKSSAFLFGARGVGKSQLCRDYVNYLERLEKAVITYDLLQGEIYQKFLKRPHLLRLEVEKHLESKKPLLVFLDEIQKVPSLLNEVHSLLESHRGKVRFLMSGSSARKLKRTGANMLAGRALSLKLHPLTDEEFPQSLADSLRLGSLPGIVVENEAPEQSLRSYVSTYLKEEIQQEALVRQIDSFARFLEVSAQYHTEVINASNIADHAGVSSQTIAEYISILEDTLIAWKLPGWSASQTKQLRTTPKLYLFDNGVANALRGELNAELVESSGRFGKMFEAHVLQEIFRFNDYHQLDLKLSYWRTNNDIEVDLIISRGAGRPLAAFEIKSKLEPEPKHLSSLARFSVDYPKVPLYCLSRATRGYRLGKIEVLPYKLFPKILLNL